MTLVIGISTDNAEIIISVKHYNGQCVTLAKWFTLQTIGL